MTLSVQNIFNQESLSQLVADILAEVKKQGGSAAEIGVGTNKGFSVAVRLGEVETVEYHQDKVIDITVYIGNRTGSATLSDMRSEAIKSAVSAAYNMAKYTDEDPFSGLAEKELLAFNYPAIDLSYPWNITVSEAIDLALACESKALSFDKRITNSEGVTITTSNIWNVYGNSHGFIGAYPVTRHELSCVLIAKEKEDMQRDYYYTLSCDPENLDSIDYVAKKAAERTIQRLGARKLKTGRFPVLFAAEEARSLWGHLIAAISGSNLYRKSSFLLDHLDKKIFPEFIKVHENPFLPKGLGSAPFDDNGVATRSNVFVDQGILRSYCLGIYSARKLGLKTTANADGVHNLFIDAGQKDFEGLLKSMDKGLLVTEVMGQGTNLVTGDYSRGASGYWVENGEIQYPVHEITIAGNLRDMFANIVEVGTDIDKRGNIQTGSVLIEEMVVAG